ncbi:hypothetical protein A6P39_038210 [Streptomyces sp. FXJ1.172]|uniref:hypothetical protein n=1 Tax=Streptomyces sp. FXJ1.172 TaxID=710705 RepID=UPI001F2830E3|nr:hypothetical protein [Streptomyces sp. FXJ1.172]WEO99408.1 hypothetical protein A6P39_038210 [Streptomyces sp. FXJ1.172]
MATTEVTGWETAVLEGGPADGLRMKVSGRPRVIQVTYPCKVEAVPPDGVRAEAVYLYRRDYAVTSEPLRYGFDIASP